MSTEQAENNGRIDYIEFPTTDIPATKLFYSSVFGWKFEDYGPDYTSFNDGRISGGFYSADGPGAKQPLIVLYTYDLEATEAAIVAACGLIVRAIFSFPGGRRFHFTDPGENELAVWSEDPDVEVAAS